MKILYIVPKINCQGGVQKLLASRTDYLITNNLAEIGIVTQNNGNNNSFFTFNKSIDFFDISTSTSRIKTVFAYKKQIEIIISTYKPNTIIVCDFGLKGFLFPFIINTKIPILFEVHGSKYNEPIFFKENKLNIISRKIKYWYRNLLIKKYEHILFLSEESKSEWNIEKGFILPNPVVIPLKKSNLSSKKVIALTRFSYEKGIDRLIEIWKEVFKINPDLELYIYGENDGFFELENNKQLYSSLNIFFCPPQINTEEIYLDASMYVMTSRSEGFPLVLLEAMSYGLPVIAYNCPIGPKAIIENNFNGFLIEDDSERDFVSKIIELANNKETREIIGNHAILSTAKYEFNLILEKYFYLLKSIIDSK